MSIGICVFIIPVIVGIAAMGLAMVPDIVGVITRQAKTVIFLCTIVLTVTAVTAVNVDFGEIGRTDLGSVGSMWEARKAGDRKARLAISRCKAFVIEEMGEYDQTAANRGNIVQVGYQSGAMWDYCAAQFGTNYWKYDTNINGRRGGDVLCKTYSRGTYRSRKVDTWCGTVFSSGE